MSMKLAAVTAVATLAATLVLLSAVAGHADAGADPVRGRDIPAHFLRGVVADIAGNEYAHAWLRLYPPHQAVAPVDEYVACELRSPIPGRLARLVVVRSVRGSFPVAGQTARVAGAAVTFLIRISEPALATSVQFKATFHAVRFAEHWTWILPAARYAMYRDDGC